MKLAPRTPGVHHVALRSADLPRSRRFYVEVIGFPVVHETPNLFLFAAGATVFAVKGPEKDSPGGDRFDPFRVGLDHVALACPEEAELRRVAAGLEAAGVPNTGVKLDEGLGRLYVAFKDPDGIAWEVYMARRSAIEAAEACVRALGDRDPGRAPLAADVTLEGGRSCRRGSRAGRRWWRPSGRSWGPSGAPASRAAWARATRSPAASTCRRRTGSSPRSPGSGRPTAASARSGPSSIPAAWTGTAPEGYSRRSASMGWSWAAYQAG